MDSQLNKVAYITGSSRGIGKALVAQLIANDYSVIGLSRSNDFEASRFKHVNIDLSDINAVKAFKFDSTATEVLLVNNAGVIGEIQPIGNLANKTFEDLAAINIIAPQILMNNFIKQFQKQAQKGHILNISSGAGKRPIDAWASYCASKAAIDLFSETIQEEWTARLISNWFIHAIAPGVVDTEMQNEIRSAKPEAFMQLEKFTALKTNNELASPKEVAALLYRVIKDPENYKTVVISVRDF